MVIRRVLIRAVRLLAVLAVFSAPVWAQWEDYPTRGVPKTKDGKPDLTAPTPRTANGKPDLTGLWEANRLLEVDEVGSEVPPHPPHLVMPRCRRSKPPLRRLHRAPRPLRHFSKSVPAFQAARRIRRGQRK